MTKYQTSSRKRKHARIRAKVSGTAEKPRLSVYRSNLHISAQIIDDVKAETLVSATSKGQAGKTFKERAFNTGKAIAEKAQKAGIKQVAFDRGGFLYTGRVQALAEGAREGGLSF
tara:strand:- start:165 stop:509 length:345 start_codon:yes stop_codon:yes gene_type:complete